VNSINVPAYGIFSDRLFAPSNMINVPWWTYAPLPSNTLLNLANVGAFKIWSTISSSGPLTVDTVGAVWISETASEMIATFVP